MNIFFLFVYFFIGLIINERTAWSVKDSLLIFINSWNHTLTPNINMTSACRTLTKVLALTHNTKNTFHHIRTRSPHRLNVRLSQKNHKEHVHTQRWGPAVSCRVSKATRLTYLFSYWFALQAAMASLCMHIDVRLCAFVDVIDSPGRRRKKI